MTFNIPNRGLLEIETIILNLNGTLAIGGKLIDGVAERIQKIKEKGIRVILISADTRGNAAQIAQDLSIEFQKAGSAEQKAAMAINLDPQKCAAIGNGLIDLEKIELAKLSIVTLQAEGVNTKTLFAADIVIPTINDALDLFLDEQRLIATLRN